eukprot:TRINITY_DN988_c0_g1_i1.p1 TRINITY_DN988_c0_g1~~TRINITY_DN988_c0_g1_i1.p1  ORF type:complete len:361 (-),score=58.46 TRINITY_DN988_c0_g1_i1:349-1431(-)
MNGRQLQPIGDWIRDNHGTAVDNQTLGKAMATFSGGVGRVVEAVCSVLAFGPKLDISDETKLAAGLRDTVFPRLLQRTDGIVPTSFNGTWEQTTAVLALYCMALFGLQVNLDESVLVVGVQVPLARLVEDACLPLQQADATDEDRVDGVVQLRFSEFMSLYTKKQLHDKHDSRLPLLQPLLSGYSAILNQGNVLEFLLRTILLFRLTLCKTVASVLPFPAVPLAFSSIETAVAPRPPVSLLPIMQKGRKLEEAAFTAMFVEKDVLTLQASPSNWPFIVRHLFKAGTFGVPGANSNGPDLLWRPDAAPRPHLIVFPCKFEIATTWQALIDELAKANHLLTTKAATSVLVVPIVREFGKENC